MDTGTSKFDLSLIAREERDGLSVAAEYATHLFEPDTIRRLLRHFEVVLKSVAAEPDLPISRIPLLTEAERRQVLVEWNDAAAADAPAACLHQLFEAQATATPEAAAVVCEGRELNYGELDRRANQLARRLQSLGVKPDTPVAVCMDRSVELVVGILGILKAGGAYVPMDPNYPSQRLALILGDCRAPVLLTTEKISPTLAAANAQCVCLDAEWEEIARLDSGPLPSSATPDNLAYVIYTSGSTGTPKGVLVTHRNIVHSTTARFAYYGTPPERFLLFPSFAFDSSVAVLFWTLCQGGTLVVPGNDEQRDIGRLAELVRRHRVTHWLSVPSAYAVLLGMADAQTLGSLQVVIVAGEACTGELYERHRQRLPGAEFYNEYGPTEGTVWSSVYRATPSDSASAPLPIGRPIPRMRAYVLDRNLAPAPIGVPGELYIAGNGVARGYLDREELTQRQFVPDPFTDDRHGRMYRTGDLVKWLPDGNLAFLGRVDNQVKIRGYRIELGEIESALRQHAGVRDAVVAACDDAPGGKQLAAYVVANDERPTDTAELRQFLAAALPDYMIPAVFVPLETIPLGPNGKVDYKALPRPSRQRDPQAEYVPPRNADEERLAEIWREVLRLERVGVYDNFFALGGHSLLATQVMSRIATRLHVEVPLRELFQTPTIAELAQCVAAAQSRRAGIARAYPHCPARRPTAALAHAGSAVVSRSVGARPSDLHGLSDAADHWTLGRACSGACAERRSPVGTKPCVRDSPKSTAGQSKSSSRLPRDSWR